MSDVYLMQHGGVALWIIAICAVLLVLLAWGVLLQALAIRKAVAPAVARPRAANFPGPETAKSPARSGEGSGGDGGVWPTVGPE